MYIKGAIGWALWIRAGSYRRSLPISTPFLTATPRKLEQRGSSRPEKEQPTYLSHFALEQTLQSLLSYTLYHSSEPVYLCVLMKSKLRSRGVEWFALGYAWSKVEMEAQRAESSLCSPITWACLFFPRLWGCWRSVIPHISFAYFFALLLC